MPADRTAETEVQHAPDPAGATDAVSGEVESRTTRPRVEGEREGEILDAALGLLVESGYDRLTMDAVATAARASKATLYRRWPRKADLVVDALCRAKAAPQVALADTGSLRGDLIAMACGHGGLSDDTVTAVMASVITALHRDREFADTFFERFLAPKVEQARTVFLRARERGEVGPDVRLDLLPHCLPAMILHRVFVLQQPVDEATVVRIIDEVVLPAVTGRRPLPVGDAPSPSVPSPDSASHSASPTRSPRPSKGL